MLVFSPPYLLILQQGVWVGPLWAAAFRRPARPVRGFVIGLPRATLLEQDAASTRPASLRAVCRRAAARMLSSVLNRVPAPLACLGACLCVALLGVLSWLPASQMGTRPAESVGLPGYIEHLFAYFAPLLCSPSRTPAARDGGSWAG